MRTISSSRLEFHEILCDALGSRNVYFQPPESIKMHYPAIVYERLKINKVSASDNMYLRNIPYTVKFIAKDPDDDTLDRILEIKKSTHERHYIADNLHHDIFTIFY